MSMKMFRKFSGIALATLGFLSVHAAEDGGALLWMIDTDTTVNRFGSVYTIEEFNAATGFSHGQIEFARIAATSETSGDSVYLYMYDEGNLGTDPVYDTTMMLNFEEVGDDLPYVGATWASFAGLEGDLADYSFAVQLGNWNNDFTVWNIEAISDGQSYEDLQAFINNSVVAVPGYEPWNPGAHNVPEPSAGLMLLIGFGFLSLRRKEVRK